MQPYFMPYIGYYQLISAVDVFVVYDNIKYTKKGWINRNRMLQNGQDMTFSLPLKKDSDSLDIRERSLSSDFNAEKLLSQLKAAYQKAPCFEQTYPLLEAVVRHQDANLFNFLHHSIVQTCRHLGLKTEIRISSTIDVDHDLRNQDKVLALCTALGATCYVNAIGGMELYSKEVFQHANIDLKFIKSLPFEYAQFDNDFLPWLSIVDVMMFNSLDCIQNQLAVNYELV